MTGVAALLALFACDVLYSIQRVGVVADQPKQIVAFCAKRYNENRDIRPDLAKATKEVLEHTGTTPGS